MATWFVSRHPGAVEWARRRMLQIDCWAEHLHPDSVSRGDTVIGILPVNLAAEVCKRGARYVNLSLDMPFDCRGREMSADELESVCARLEEYIVSGVTA